MAQFLVKENHADSFATVLCRAMHERLRHAK